MYTMYRISKTISFYLKLRETDPLSITNIKVYAIKVLLANFILYHYIKLY